MTRQQTIPPDEFATARLRLRLPVPGDAAAVFEGYAQDPEVTRYLLWAPHRNIRETRAFLKKAAEARASGTEYTWSITLKESGAMLGMVALRITAPRADFGYVLARRYWNRGYATEAAAPVVKWALEQEGIYRLWSVCDVDNAASVRVLEKLGLTREGILRRWMSHSGSGVPRDCYCYSKIKDDLTR